MNNDDVLIDSGIEIRDADKIEIYKLYVESAEKTSARRLNTNSFFLTINTALIAFDSYLQLGVTNSTNPKSYWVVSIVGLLISLIWYKLIESYKKLNSGKFKIILRLENDLAIRPYTAEWKLLGEGKEPLVFLKATSVEVYIPWVFFLFHFIVFSKTLFL